MINYHDLKTETHRYFVEEFHVAEFGGILHVKYYSRDDKQELPFYMTSLIQK